MMKIPNKIAMVYGEISVFIYVMFKCTRANSWLLKLTEGIQKIVIACLLATFSKLANN
jgi:hypothetical protein